MNLQETLSSILKSTYGEDVRQAILNGLGLCYSERASGGYDLVEDLNDFQNGILLCTTSVTNHPFNETALVASGGSENSRCQVAFPLTDPGAGAIRILESETWTAWENLVNEIMYFINYRNQDGYGDPLYTERVSEGHNGQWSGVAEKASTAQYDYIFAGWSRSPNQTTSDENAVTNITANRDVFAAFTSQVRSYTVRFINGDTVMSTKTVVYGNDVSDSGLAPTKSSTPQYSYTFIGWNTDPLASEGDTNALKNITGNRDLYAIYRSTVRSYQVKFMNGSTELQTVTVPYGGNAVYSGTTPTKPSTAQYDYSFVGWNTADGATVGDDNATRNIIANRIVYAAFSSEALVYTVRFMNGATILETVPVQYGGTAVYSGEDPTKESTAQYRYVFADGWNTDPNATAVDPNATKNVSGDRDLYAVFTPVLRQYTVTFYNGETKLSSADVNYGGNAAYSGTTPTKSSSAQYNYTFAGWARSDGQTEVDSTALKNITGPRDVYAVFTSSVRNYTVRFLDNGNVLQTKSVPYGSNVTYTGEDPTRERTAQYTYSWVGWNGSPNQTTNDANILKNIIANRDIYAAFSRTVNTYVVSFYYNGQLLDTDTVAYGGTAVYDAATPTKPISGGYRYTFDGWNSVENQTAAEPGVLENITGTKTVYAAFKELSISCNVRFFNGTTLLYTDTVDYGQNATYVGNNPTKAADVYYTYSFIGWNSSADQTTADSNILNNIQDDKDVYAAYSRTAVQYAVTFSYNGTTLDTQHTTYGGTVTYHGQQPTKTGDAQYSYTFAGWNTDAGAASPDANALKNVTAARTVYPIFTRTVNKYTVRFMNGETVLQTLSVPYGSDAVYSGATPVHPTDPDDYTFIGWEPNGTNITGNTDCQPVWLGMEGFTRQIVQRTISGTYENSIATSIGQRAFANCTNLKSISFPNVTTVYNSAFAGCTSLASVALPNLSYIQANAFVSCTSLSVVIIGTEYSGVCSAVGDPFQDVPSTMMIYVPDSRVNNYQASNYWSLHRSQISGISYLPSE